MNFIEFKNFGFNPMTYAFLGTVVTGIILSAGLLKQRRKINEEWSGLSVPMATNIYFAFHFFSFGVYGFRQNSLAMILNGLIGFLWLLVYLTAGRHPDSTGKRLWHFSFFLLPVLTAIVPEPGKLMTLLYITASIFLLGGPIAVYKAKDSGAVDLEYVRSFIISGIFWAIYSASIGEWPLFIANLFGISVMAVLFFLYKRYKKSGPFPVGYFEGEDILG